jgi:hypothetical protein
MEVFQILGAAAMLITAAYYAYQAFSNRYFETAVDKFGRTRKRDIRNGRFVKAN